MRPSHIHDSGVPAIRHLEPWFWAMLAATARSSVSGCAEGGLGGAQRREAPLRAERSSRTRQQWLEKADRRTPPDAKPATQHPALTGADLAAWRKRHGLNQQSAALRLGVTQGTISKAERKGTKPLGPALQRALQRALAGER